MKWLLIILFPAFTFAQSDTCFTTQQVLDISFTLDSLYELTDANKKIIREQELLIQDLKHYIALDTMQINFHKKQNDMLQKNINLYVEREKYIKPKWYDNKVIWFTGGILTSIVTAKLIVEVVK